MRCDACVSLKKGLSLELGCDFRLELPEVQKNLARLIAPAQRHPGLCKPVPGVWAHGLERRGTLECRDRFPKLLPVRQGEAKAVPGAVHAFITCKGLPESGLRLPMKIRLLQHKAKVEPGRSAWGRLHQRLQMGNCPREIIVRCVQVRTTGQRIAVTRPELQHAFKSLQSRLWLRKHQQRSRLYFQKCVMHGLFHLHRATPICRQTLTLATTEAHHNNSSPKNATNGT